MGNKDDKPTEQQCSILLDKEGEIPDACKQYASVRARLEKDKPIDPFAGMGGGSSSAVRNAQIQRRMSTRHNQGPAGKKSSWF